MLIKLNKGEGITVQANHSDKTNAYTIMCYDGEKVYIREFPSGNKPPNSEELERNDSGGVTSKCGTANNHSDEICEWKGYVDDCNRLEWHTECGEHIVGIEHDYKYCPYCGRKLRAVR